MLSSISADARAYYAGGARVMQGGVPCRVAAWATPAALRASRLAMHDSDSRFRIYQIGSEPASPEFHPARPKAIEPNPPQAEPPERVATPKPAPPRAPPAIATAAPSPIAPAPAPLLAIDRTSRARLDRLAIRQNCKFKRLDIRGKAPYRKP